MRSTTSTVLVPGWRWIARVIGRGRRCTRPPTLSFSTLSITRPSSLQAHRRAVAVGDDHGAGTAAALMSWPVACTVIGLARAPQRAGRAG